jgi:large subunit ribosomal protein L21
MYAIVKTGGKQYKVEPGTVVSIEKLDAEIGDEVELPVIFVADGDTIEADPEKAAATKVVAEILDQYKGKKQLVFKFKKRKGYKKLKGHRQQLTKVRVIAVGDQKVEKKAAVESAAVEASEAEEAASEEA